MKKTFLCGLIFLATFAARPDGEKNSTSTRLEAVEQSLDTQGNPHDDAWGRSNLLMLTLTNFQDKLHAIELTFDRYLAEAESSATRLATIEQALDSQRARQTESTDKSNRLVLTFTAAFGAVGILAFLAAAWLNWRAATRLTAVSRMSALGFGRATAALDAGNLPATSSTDSNLLGTISRLERRIRELEESAHVLPPHEPAETQTNGHAQEPTPLAGPDSMTATHIKLLLGKGQSLFHLNKLQEAIACFDEVLAIEPGHADALLKKGSALERQEKLQEAVDCYDRAIEADDSLTIAYLQKGGVFNRLELYSMAQECYEQALRTQEKRSAA